MTTEELNECRAVQAVTAGQVKTWGGKLAAAMAKAQAAFPKIVLDKKVHVTAKDPTKPGYDFWYATLGNMIYSTRKGLTDNGIAVMQPYEDGFLVTRILHESGEYMESRLASKRLQSDMPGPMQELGGELSYLRRYSLSAMLNIVGEDDNDANDADGNQFTDKTTSGKKSPPPPTPALDKAKAEGRVTLVPAAKPATTPPPVASKAAAPAAATKKPAAAAKPAESKAPPAAVQVQGDLEHPHPLGVPTPEDPVITLAIKQKIIKAMAQFGITQAEIEAWAGYPIDMWSGSAADKTIGMRAQLNIHFQALTQARKNKAGEACNKELFLKSEFPAIDFPALGA